MSETRTIPFSRADVAEALGDYLLARGGRPPKDLHPVAEKLLDPISPRSLTDIAAHLSGTRDLGRALVMSDFAGALATGMGRVVALSYDETAAEHVPLLWDVEVRDLRPIELPTIDLGDLAQTPDASGPIQMPTITTSGGERAQALLWSARLLVGRRLLVSDDAGILAAAMVQLGAAGARIEAQQIATVLEANASLADGAALFGAGNTASGGAATATGLGNALGLLRTAANKAGGVLNLRGALWLVPAASEVDALKVVRDISTGEPRMKVIPNAWLAAGTSYVLAAPSTAPVLARVALTPGAPPRIDQRRAPPDFDGMGFRCEHVVGILAVSRQGIVKLTA